MRVEPELKQMGIQLPTRVNRTKSHPWSAKTLFLHSESDYPFYFKLV